MLKLQMSLLFGERIGNLDICYCLDQTTNKFYRRILTVQNDNSMLEILEEVPAEMVENYMFQRNLSAPNAIDTN